MSTVLVSGLYAALTRKSKHRQSLVAKPETVAREVSEDPEYDVVIIGGGTAGCVLASRLSEDPTIRVLLLEAGDSSRDVLWSKIPAGISKMMHTHRDYDLWTEPQVNAAGAKKYWPRAKMLGGCEFHAGAPSDYDEWAASFDEGAEGWADKEFRKYFLKFEKFTPHDEYPNVDVKMRGANGPVNVGYFGYCSNATKKWIEACVNMGIPANPDINTPAGTLGVTKVLTYIDKNGTRVTSESSYLTVDVLKRPNLKVAIHSHVTKIIFDTSGESKRATGVEFSNKKGGPRYRVKVKKEVVLSAGAIHSPHILMLSGVGPKEHLEKHEIPVVHDLRGVGQNLQDHPVVSTRLHFTAGHSIQHITATSGLALFKVLGALANWTLRGKGPLTCNVAEGAAFVRSDDKKLFPPDKYKVKDETSGPNAPDLELFFVPVGYTEHGCGPVPPGDLGTLGAVLLRPQSRGSITLKSSDPFDAPLIDPKYLNSTSDVALLVRGLKLLIKLANTEPMLSALKQDDNPLLDHNLGKLSDDELENEVRKRVETLYHPTSTCSMAPLEDNGVVDPSLKVYGLENVRVADASIFPRIVAGHTTAPSLAVGEKASDLIKESLAAKAG
ncbi:alcohol oxidase [Hysterangium stoloniferum]|nr:alcohol oxidase [Hysterangium stoloniferum]